MDFRILGPLEVRQNGAPLDLGARQQRILTALLVLNAGRVVSTDRILEVLWGDDSDGKERALWVYISRIRSVLDPQRKQSGEDQVLVTRDHGYSLAIAPEAVDSNRFEAAVATARNVLQDDPSTAADQLREAEELWRGSALEEFRYEEFAQPEIARLEELRLAAIEDRVDADLRIGRSGDLVSELEALHQLQPFRERVVGQLMLAMYRSGRQADALRTFERFRRHVGEELGIEPSPELVRLEEQVLLHDSRIQTRRAAPVSTPAPVGSNPFKGLRAFREDDSTDFHGRDRVIADVVRRLDQGDPLIGLVGPSGSGKSSIVRAGVIPALRKGAIEGSDSWTVAQMTPGSQPFAELEAALLRSSLDAPESLGEQLADPDAGLLRAALRILPADDSSLLLVVDQFEELFTLVDDETLRARFLDQLLSAIDDAHGRVKLLLTLRADFYAKPLAYPDFGARLGDAIVNVVPLRPDDLELAAERPAEAAGVSLEPALTASLLTDVAGRPGALPLFQYALTELFDRRDGGRLTLSTYEAMNGVSGVLSRRADDLYSELDEFERVAAEQLFLRLVTIAEGDEWGRRRVVASEVLSLDVDVVALQGVIDRYTAARLLTVDRDFVSGSPTVEVAHEALLTEWGRLKEWIQLAREDVKRHAALSLAMLEWTEAGKHPDYLLTGSRLVGYETWAASAVMHLTTEQRVYLDTATKMAEDQKHTEAHRSASEQRTARSAKRRLWGLAAAIAILVATGTTALLIALAPGPPMPPTIALVGPDTNLVEQQMDEGFTRAAGRLDFEPRRLDPISDVAGEFAALLATEPQLVVLSSDFVQGMNIDLRQIGEDHPSVALGVVGSVPGQSDFVSTNAIIAEEEGSFLIGAAAALESRTGVVGFVGGDPNAADGVRAGFEAGARAADPDVEVLVTYLLGFRFAMYDTPLVAQDQARRVYEAGADVVYHATGNAGVGVFAAAAEQSDILGRHLWVIGVDADEYQVVDDDMKEHVLTSMVKRHDVAVEVLIEQFLGGAEEADLTLGVEENAVVYSTAGGHLDPATIRRLDELRLEIIDGSIVVPKFATEPASFAPPPDLVVNVTIDGATCMIDAAPEPGLGDVAQFRLTNNHQDLAIFEVHRLVAGTTLRDALASRSMSVHSELEIMSVEARPNTSRLLTADLVSPGEWGVACEAMEVEYPALVFSVAVPEPQHVGSVSRAETGCAYEGSAEFRLGDIARFDLVSTAKGIHGFSVGEVADGVALSDIRRDGTLAHQVRQLDAKFFDGPGSGSLVVEFDTPGTWVLDCPRLGRPGATAALFTVAE